MVDFFFAAAVEVGTGGGGVDAADDGKNLRNVTFGPLTLALLILMEISGRSLSKIFNQKSRSADLAKVCHLSPVTSQLSEFLVPDKNDRLEIIAADTNSFKLLTLKLL